ncbi:MAG: diacylglycerol/lipid kinase family protein [Candidatus Kariarchaeaceae archaeon]|jgi:YegS/Rv2252/BmrU family lipid kinase
MIFVYLTEKSYYFICNPVANTGRMKKKWPKLLETITSSLEKDSFDWIFTEHPQQSMKIAQKAAEHGYKNIIAVGGDGVANEVANSIISNNLDVIFGMIPMGTSNDISLSLNLSLDPETAFDTLLKGNTEKIAVGKFTGDFGENPYYFLNHGDCGLAAIAAMSSRDGWKILKGELKYTWHALKKILSFKRNPGRVIVDGEERAGELTVVAASNGEILAGYKVFPGNHYQMDDFGVVIATGQSRFRLLKLMLAAEKGNHVNLPGVEYIRGKKIEIFLENPWAFQAEGEMFTEASREICIEHIPEAITMLMGNTDPLDSQKNDGD